MTSSATFIPPKKRVSLTARWVFPVDANPLEQGVIEIEAGGIVAVHQKRNSAAIDLGNVAIIPSLVNCHTHLELSDLSSPLETSTSFAHWIRSVITHRQERTEASQKIYEEGLQEATISGSTLVGDIVGVDWKPADSLHSKNQVIAFRELIGLLPEQQTEQLAAAKQHIDVIQEFISQNKIMPHLLSGLSPHAPYSVGFDLLKSIAHLATERNVPLAMHLAETTEEIELLKNGRGGLVEMLKEFGIWHNDLFPFSTTPLDYLKILATAPRALVVHGNYLSDEEIDFLAAHRQMTTIYCPRTHAYFSHSQHPWLQLLKKGANVALGTDSRASNPDLSLWQELLYLHQTNPKIPPQQLLELGTLAGARAFGLEEETGSLQAGKFADLAVVSLAKSNTNSPDTLLLQPSNQIIATMKRGEWLYQNDSVQHLTNNGGEN
ncbi:hypothetical protein MNBD_PLANCTO02-2617 [hydrothermal vent metagenome]|uniref:Amidohydrolase-related domain-containing protein n=1 Tax=hydrothermal vent metagenome TaxID=652676 RepID=A0A3B1E4V2_9ZZZZ